MLTYNSFLCVQLQIQICEIVHSAAYYALCRKKMKF